MVRFFLSSSLLPTRCENKISLLLRSLFRIGSVRQSDPPLIQSNWRLLHTKALSTSMNVMLRVRQDGSGSHKHDASRAQSTISTDQAFPSEKPTRPDFRRKSKHCAKH
uniref:(northern house mosquito) hypothetical protein n=1 Tax=Culex pipiens TaxID=7175 RepID=A0A8D8NFM3_CULPI